jgi:hypothetical protein
MVSIEWRGHEAMHHQYRNACAQAQAFRRGNHAALAFCACRLVSGLQQSGIRTAGRKFTGSA